MKIKALAAVAFLALSLPASASAAKICAMPIGQRTIEYTQYEKNYGELEIESLWKASKPHRVNIRMRVWVNGRLEINDRWTDRAAARYELAAAIGLKRQPRWVRYSFTVKSKDCTRTARGFKAF